MSDTNYPGIDYGMGQTNIDVATGITMQHATIRSGNLEFTFTDSDIANPDDFTPTGNRSVYDKSCGWLLHDHGFTVCVVFADSLQDALDIACDEGKLNRYLIPHPGNTPDAETSLELLDYATTDAAERCDAYGDGPEFNVNGVDYWWQREVTFLGNASEPFDIDTLGYVEFACPQMSVVRLMDEHTEALSVHCA